jgi:hypothetical protein
MENLMRAIICLGLAGCGGIDQDEIGHMAGDVMASLDESGDGGGVAWRAPPVFRGRGFLRSPADRAWSLVEGEAAAGSCLATKFTDCAAGARAKTFDKCTVLGYTLDGTVNLAFSDMACALNAQGQTVTRTAAFTLTGPRGATLAVSSPGGGQKLTDTGAGYAYSVAGMERVATTSNGAVLFDISTRTTSDILVTGSSRANRVVNGGALEVTHKKRDYVVTLVPNNLTWASTCNCAVSGSWTGTATGSVTGEWKVEITGCGKAKVTARGKSEDVDLDRCAAL